MIHDFDAALSMLHQIKKLGVGISMDDFGTGYSSLSYLRSFPFDKIKIDQSFVRQLGLESDGGAIIRAVIGMCESLGATVIAEGVETERQLDLLRAERCTDIQGYLVSKPLPAKAIPKLISDFDAALAMLHQLKKLGLSIAMDDFGTGYSSLSYLRSFPFDKIKIDQSFVRELGQKSDCTAIIRAVTGMCESLGITATAEGVETRRQLRLLQGERCTEVQGYLISKPLPAHEIPALITDFRQNGRPDLFQPVSSVSPAAKANP
jgi:EAL domain-containing protein (putative c-di-GMP-specific phosphodiesterase class I)